MAEPYKDICNYPLQDLLVGWNQPFALDTETLGKTRASNIPMYFSWASRNMGAGAGPTFTEAGYSFLTALCSHPRRPKIFHNAKFDMWVLWREGIEVEGPIEDTILMHCLLDEHHILPGYKDNKGHHKLKILSRTILKRPRIDEFDLHVAQRGTKTNLEVPQKIMHKYAVPDAVDTLDLYYIFKEQLIKQNLWNLYRQTVQTEMVYLEMFKRGVALDLDNLEKALKKILEKLNELAERIWIVFDEKFKLSSPKQVGPVLKKHFNLTKKTKTGWCTDKDALEPFRSDFKMQLFLAWKFLDKARQYLQGYKKRHVNGRLYAEYRQTTVTGRSKCSNPNLENIPKSRGNLSVVEVGNAELAEFCAAAFRYVRSCITAAPGALLLAKDYQQVEYRCFVFYSRSERLIQALERGEDFHSYVCNLVFGPETEQLRYITKIINYGLIYGMGNPLLITRIKMYHDYPHEVLRQYEKLLPEMRETQKRLKMTAAQKGYLIDVFGRRYRYLAARPHAVVAWLNQGTAANIKKMAMNKVAPILEGCKSGLEIDIHDELIFEMFPEDAHLAYDLHTAMEDFPQFGRIPIKVDTAVGPNLLDLKEVDTATAVDYLRTGKWN
jgi:DNA polymerase-1